MFEVLSNFWFLVAVTIIVCSVTATIAQAWQKARRTEQETALKQEMLRRGLSVEEMERVLRASSKPQQEAALSADQLEVENLVERLGAHNASGRVIEQVLAAIRSADPALKRGVCRAVISLLDNTTLEGEAKDEQALAVARGLCPPDRPAAVEEAPPASPAKSDETFQPVRPV